MDRSELIRDWNYQRTPEPPGEYWRTITADRFGGPDVEWQLWRGATGWELWRIQGTGQEAYDLETTGDEQAAQAEAEQYII